MMDLRRIVVAAFFLAGLSLTPGVQDGETKDLVERTCAKCHTMVSTYRMRNTRERWAQIVDDMVSRGAEASDDEIEQIIDYLSAYYGAKVNLNKASAEELSTSLRLELPAAKSIVDYRAKNGAFGKLDDLKAVPNLNWKTIESQKDRIEFLK